MHAISISQIALMHSCLHRRLCSNRWGNKERGVWMRGGDGRKGEENKRGLIADSDRKEGVGPGFNHQDCRQTDNIHKRGSYITNF